MDLNNHVRKSPKGESGERSPEDLKTAQPQERKIQPPGTEAHFEKRDLSSLESIKSELDRVYEFFLKIFSDYQQSLDRKPGPYDPPVDIGFLVYFGNRIGNEKVNLKIPEHIETELKKISLSLAGGFISGNLYELIHNLSLNPHLARVYGPSLGQLKVDLHNAIHLLDAIISRLR